MLRELFGSTKPKQLAQPQPKPAAPAPSPRPDSVLGANSHFEGTLRAEGNIRIEGAFLGDVTTTGRVVIGEHGTVEGNLIGESVETAGVVKGNVIARRVSVSRTGRILGDLRLEKLMTEEGGFIQGLVTMEETVNPADHMPLKEQPDEAPLEVKQAPQAEAAPVKVKVAAAKAGKG